MRLSLTLVLVVMLLAVLGAPTIAQDNGEIPPVLQSNGGPVAQLRFAHYSSDAPTFEIYVDGQFSGIQTIKFGDITGWIQFPAGRHAISFVQLGGDPATATVLGPLNANLPPGSWNTVSIVGSQAEGSLGIGVAQENYSEPLPPATGRMTVFNGIQGIGPVDLITSDGRVLITSIPPGRSGSVDLPEGTYDLRIVRSSAGANSAGLNARNLYIRAGEYYIMSAVRTDRGTGLALESVGSEVDGLIASSNALAGQALQQPQSQPQPTQSQQQGPRQPAQPPPPPEPISPLLIGGDILDSSTLLPEGRRPVLPIADEILENPLAPIDASTIEREGEPMNLYDTIRNDPRLARFGRAVDLLELRQAFSRAGSITVFAPIDAAFAFTPPDVVSTRADLRRLILYHLVTDPTHSYDLFDQMRLTTIGGDSLQFQLQNGAISINDTANILVTNIEATNGIIHIIDRVLIPPAPEAEATPEATEAAVE
jgi:uncharacterized surface protein with fasciclin (FAS1) repeats